MCDCAEAGTVHNDAAPTSAREVSRELEGYGLRSLSASTDSAAGKLVFARCAMMIEFIDLAAERNFPATINSSKLIFTTKSLCPRIAACQFPL